MVCWFLTTWRLTSMWRKSVASAFASCVNCAPSLDTESTMTLIHGCLCLKLHALLLQSVHRVTALSYRQASARPQRSCPCHNRHQEVWQWFFTDTTSRASLAGCHRVAATVHQCLHGMAAAYLTELCTPVAASASRRGGLRSSTTSDLVIPRCRLSTYGSRAFSVAGPVCWNALPDYLKPPDISFNCFRQNILVKNFCFADIDNY